MLGASAMPWFNFPRLVAKLFSQCEEREFQVKLAAYTDDVYLLLKTIKEGSKGCAEEALQSLAYWTASRGATALKHLIEEKALKVLSERLVSNSNQMIKQHILVIFESLCMQNGFTEEAQKEGILKLLVGALGEMSRSNLHLTVKIILELVKKSELMTEELVMCDGLEHVVKWVERRDKILRSLGSEILLIVSQGRADFRVLMAVEGCIQAAFKVLGHGQVNCSISVSKMLSNMSYIHDVRLIMIRVGTIHAMLNCLQGKCLVTVRHAMTVLANLSVIPEARKVIRKQGGIPMIVGLLDSVDMSIVSMAACGLANLAIEGSSQAIIRDAGAIPILGNLLMSDSKYTAALALGNMARSDHLRKQIIEGCGTEKFVEMLWDSNGLCREEGLRVLVQLCMHQEAREDAITLRAPARLVELFEDESPTVRWQAVHCLTTIAEGIRISFSVFCEKSIIGVLNLLKDSSPGCRDRAAETLQWLVNDSPDVQSLVLEHKALDTLLALMDDTLEDGTITDACTYSSICLYHLSKHQRHIVETIAHAGIIPRLVDVIHASGIEIKRIAIRLVRMLVDVPGQCKVITEGGQVPMLVDLLTIADEECREPILAILASCSAHQEALECIVDNCQVKGGSEDENLCIANKPIDGTWLSAQAAKAAIAAHEALSSIDDGEDDRKEAGLRILTSWYSSRSMGDLLSDEEIHLASLMPNRLLKAIAHELRGSNGWSSHSGDSPRII